MLNLNDFKKLYKQTAIELLEHNEYIECEHSVDYETHKKTHHFTIKKDGEMCMGLAVIMSIEATEEVIEWKEYKDLRYHTSQTEKIYQLFYKG